MAAMTLGRGRKRQFPALPRCVSMQIPIFLQKPPGRLTASGVSDLMGKYICLADWKIANLLTGEYYCEYLAEMEEKALKAVKGSLRAIASGEEEACEKLMYGLILSRLAMQMAGNSRPA